MISFMFAMVVGAFSVAAAYVARSVVMKRRKRKVAAAIGVTYEQLIAGDVDWTSIDYRGE